MPPGNATLVAREEDTNWNALCEKLVHARTIGMAETLLTRLSTAMPGNDREQLLLKAVAGVR